jgi:hypothetical protein
MHILNQDKDMVFTLTDKGEVFSSMQTVNDVLMGWNVYGRKIKKLFRATLLGTYDTESDAHQIVEEIKRLYKIGCTYYAMPEPADINELEVI